MESLLHQFYQRLPARAAAADDCLHLLNDREIEHIRRSQRQVMLAAALLSVLGFLAYYLPIYRYSHLFPSFNLTIPLIGTVFRFAWGELLWCVLLTSVELYLLTLLNIFGVHEIAVATGFINSVTKLEKGEAILQIGLEKKTTEASRYGIDPFQGLNQWMLFLFNFVLRLKGWFANQVMRFLVRLLLGRYAVRTLLDFSGMPIYMAINAYSVHAVMREARVIIMGQAIVSLVIQRLPQHSLSAKEKELLYDTLQFIAVSKRDFHQNHYLLTKELLEFFHVPSEKYHLLLDDYPEKLRQAPAAIAALCQLIILLGFILDGHISWRERLKLQKLNRLGVLRESYSDLKQYALGFLNGSGVDVWATAYLEDCSKAASENSTTSR
ncbi:MAG: LBF_2804 family protein [Blastocatellia bacterium]